MDHASPQGGTRTFFTLWFGQLVSLIGSQLTGFALGVWVYDITRSVLMLALTQIAMQLPFVLLSPLAGVLADRWNRRTAMILSDLGAGLVVLGAGLLFLSQRLQPWMVIPINLCLAAFNSLMWPAYSASITQLVPKEQFGRANGLVQLGEAVPQIAGPALAGVLYLAIRPGNMALIDFATYLFSVLLMLFFVSLPRPAQTGEGRRARGSLWEEMKFGWDYIVRRRGLFTLMMFYLAINFLSGIMQPLMVPLVLDRWKPDIFGYLSTVMGIGMLAGTLVMSTWGGGKRKVYTMLIASLIASIFIAAVGLRTTIPFLAVCAFGFMFCMPLMNASNQAIWQSKVEADVQGRVFAVRRAIVWSTMIVSPLLAAPLADNIFKPGMAPGGFLAPLFGPWIGVGSIGGVPLLMGFLGLLSLAVTLLAGCSASLRHVETDLPDLDAAQSYPATIEPGEPISN